MMRVAVLLMTNHFKLKSCEGPRTEEELHQLVEGMLVSPGDVHLCIHFAVAALGNACLVESRSA
jgi:hypothetical protein